MMNSIEVRIMIYCGITVPFQLSVTLLANLVYVLRTPGYRLLHPWLPHLSALLSLFGYFYPPM